MGGAGFYFLVSNIDMKQAIIMMMKLGQVPEAPFMTVAYRSLQLMHDPSKTSSRK